METTGNASNMLTTGQVARTFGVSQVSVRSWVKKGWLPCVKTPLGRLFDPAEVKRFARERDVKRRKKGRGGYGD